MDKPFSPEALKELATAILEPDDGLELTDMLNDWCNCDARLWDVVHRILQKAEGLRATAVNP
jgi:hypothetical protein